MVSDTYTTKTADVNYSSCVVYVACATVPPSLPSCTQISVSLVNGLADSNPAVNPRFATQADTRII